MTTQSRTVRVFLSSTFRDFAEERDLLVRKIFPELRRKCRERQVELVDVDLRWGITEEEAQQGKVLPICLAEIDRSRPYFMGFIGDRYGWVPEKDQYDLSLLLEQSWLDEHRGGKSVTELEMLHGVLNNPAMEDRAFFYFRDSAYSQAKGGAYLSEGPQEKAKLEALKDRIRQSGFPVVENYRSPEELAERVRDDLWKLIDEAFPESEVPDALVRERMRHEAFTASRLGLYIGGESYFAKIDSAMPFEPRRPVLVTGDSGGGKSALLANWASRFSQNNPSAILLTHCLATGADAAQPVNMAVRILREISRITGEELVLEGDPRKALHMLSPWLAKAGAFAAQKGGLFVLVLDGLDKMDAQNDMGWWPSMLPEGVGLVASCLSGKVFDAIASRMDWEKLLVSPLQREDCETFIASHLGKYRKSLTPELTSKILAHPLSGNPLFLRTLLEELRVFGVHEELGPKLDHYLTSQTVDDLFERVLERVESDNSPESVRAVLEVLWAAKESFAEDELLAVSGLPPAVWAPIHIALDESLIGAGGRLAFSHDYLRKAVEDRYLPSAEDRKRIQNRMAEFCAQAMAGGRKDISHYVRRHAVEHFLEAEDWDNATAALSDLEFIEARAIAQELPAMLTDYAEAVKLLPEGEKERQTEAERQAELDRYAREMYEYSATWTRIREGSNEAEPYLPRPVESVRLWTEEEIAAERKRITETPNRLDIVKAFRVFVAMNSAPLQQYSTQEGFVANLARNDAPAGPVHEEGERRLEPLKCIKLIKQFAPDEIYKPFKVCNLILEKLDETINCMELSIDERSIIVGTIEGKIHFFSTNTGVILKTLEGHQDAVISISVCRTGNSIYTSSLDKTIRIWDAFSGECLAVLAGHSHPFSFLSLSNDSCSLISGGEQAQDGCSLNGSSVRIWDSKTGKCKYEIYVEGHLKHIELCKNESHLLIVSYDGYGNTLDCKIWNIQNGCCELVVNTIKWYCRKIIFTKIRDCFLLFYSENREVKLIDPSSENSIKILAGHEADIECLALSPDNSFLVSGSGDATIRIWSVQTGECLKILHGHHRIVESVSVSRDGKRIVSTSSDQTRRIWDVDTGLCIRILEKHPGVEKTFIASSDLRMAITLGQENSIRIWDILHGETSKVVNNLNSKKAFSGYLEKDREGNAEQILFLKTSLDGTKILYGNYLGYNIQNKKNHPRGGFTDGTYFISNICITNCGKHIVIVENIYLDDNIESGIRLIESESCKEVSRFEYQGAEITAIDLSSCGNYFVVGSCVGEIFIGEIKTGKCSCLNKEFDGKISSVAFSPDGQTIISGNYESTIRFLKKDTGICFQEIYAQKNGVTALAISPDGKMIVSSTEDGSIHFWDKNSCQLLAAYSAGFSAFSTLVYSGNSKFALLGCENMTLKVLDTSKYTCLSNFFLRDLSKFATYSGNQKIVAAFLDGRIENYDLQNIPKSPFITTAHREILSEDLPAGPVTARPPCCGQRISIPAAITDRIEYWTHEGGEGGYTDPALLLDCPSCSTPLRMNPFFVDVKPASN